MLVEIAFNYLPLTAEACEFLNGFGNVTFATDFKKCGEGIVVVG